jgi:hypothetical protein
MGVSELDDTALAELIDALNETAEKVHASEARRYLKNTIGMLRKHKREREEYKQALENHPKLFD